MSSASTTETIFPLLILPRELRERIYIAVLRMSTPSPAPSFPVSMADRVPGESFWSRDPYSDNCIRYPVFPPPITTSALLTINRQVHAEVKGVISRKESTPRPLIYKLDCMIVDEKHLYPTWLSIPAPSSSVDVVEANFRLFGVLKGDLADWSRGDGRPGPMHLRLLELLDRFLKRGPDFLSRPKSTGMKIGELVLNVVTPEPYQGFILEEPHPKPHYVPWTDSRWEWPERRLIYNTFTKKLSRAGGLVNHPEAVVREIDLGFRRLWNSSIGRDIIAQKSVGIIQLCLDGQKMHTWDVKGMTVD